jgi:predicted nucleic acid-binding protein
LKVFLDTSVMVAAFWGDHPGHEVSLRVFSKCSKKTGACGAHSLAEIYAVMTALPVRPLLLPEQVFLFVEQVSDRLAVISLSEAEYLRTIQELAAGGSGGGRVYDALLLSCARKSKAEVVYTWNLGHFRRLAPDLAERIRTPDRA